MTSMVDTLLPALSRFAVAVGAPSSSPAQTTSGKFSLGEGADLAGLLPAPSGARAVALGKDPREFGAQEEDLGGVVDPDHENHHRSGCSVCRPDAGFAEIEADQGFARGK